MLRRCSAASIVCVVVAAKAVIFTAAIVYALLRPDPAGVRAARSVVGSMRSPPAMSFVGNGTDQKAPYRDYLVNDDKVDDLRGEVVLPEAFVLDDRFREGRAPHPFGDWLILASWTGPDPERDGKRCSVSVQSTKEVRIEATRCPTTRSGR